MISKPRAWIGFWLLALIWGSSFLFIRIGVEQLSTFQLVFIRSAIAAIGLNLVVYFRGKRLPTDAAGVRDVVFLGVMNTVIPFALITWGEHHIESSVAAVLQGTAALFTMVTAHWVFADERMTPRKVVGLLFGFLGVVVLAGRWPEGAATTNPRLYILGQLAIVVASACYAIGGTYSRKAIQQRLEPIVVAAGTMTVTAAVSGVIAYGLPVIGGEAPIALNEMTTRVFWAIIVLGLVNTFVAYILFYSIIQTLGAGRASMVTYVIPAVGIALGALFLGEPVDARLLVGAAMVVGSIGIANTELGKASHGTADGDLDQRGGLLDDKPNQQYRQREET